MALVREKDGKRLHVKSALMGESLVSKEFIEKLAIAPQERLYPDVAIMKIGGQSICDRGVKALPAILKEIVQEQTRAQNTGDDRRRYQKSAYLHHWPGNGNADGCNS